MNRNSADPCLAFPAEVDISLHIQQSKKPSENSRQTFTSSVINRGIPHYPSNMI